MDEKLRISKAIYLLYLIQRNRIGINVKWAVLKPLMSFLFGENIFNELKDNLVISTFNEDATLEVININDLSYDIDQQAKEELFQSVISYFAKFDEVSGIMHVVYLYRKLATMIVETIILNMNINCKSCNPELKLAMPIIVSDDFYYSKAFADYSKNEIKKLKFDINSFTEYLNQKWFIKLIIMVKDGEYGNYSYSKTSENIDPEFYNGVIFLIKNDGLASIVMHLDEFLSNKKINNAITKYNYKNLRKEKIRRFYDWLSIANDIAVGMEFLVGSFLFLPNHNELDGVYLFIIGSSQLLIRPMINIVRRAHLFLLSKINR